jgi:predicted transcriptional regulator YdeE
MRGYEEKIIDEVFEIPDNMKLSGVAWDIFLNPKFKQIEKESMKWLESHGFSAYHGRWIERANNTRDGKIDVYLPIVEQNTVKSPFGMDFRFWYKRSSQKTLAEKLIWKDRDTDEIISEPKVETRNAFTVAGLVVHHMDKSEDIIHVWEQFRNEWQDKLEPIRIDHTIVGLAIPSQEAGSWHYLAGIKVKADAVVPEGITIYDVPAGVYAKVKTTVEEMEYTYFTLYKNWLPDSLYEKDMGLPAIDILSQDGDSMTIYVPVKHPN